MLRSILLNVSFVYFIVEIIKGFQNGKFLPFVLFGNHIAVWNFEQCCYLPLEIIFESLDVI